MKKTVFLVLIWSACSIVQIALAVAIVLKWHTEWRDILSFFGNLVAHFELIFFTVFRKEGKQWVEKHKWLGTILILLEDGIYTVLVIFVILSEQLWVKIGGASISIIIVGSLLLYSHVNEKRQLKEQLKEETKTIDKANA